MSEQLPREIRPDEVRVGDRIRLSREDFLEFIVGVVQTKPTIAFKHESNDDPVYPCRYNTLELVDRPEHEKKHKYAVGQRVEFKCRCHLGLRDTVSSLHIEGNGLCAMAPCYGTNLVHHVTESQLTPIEEPEQPKWTPRTGTEVVYGGEWHIVVGVFKFNMHDGIIMGKDGENHWVDWDELTPWEDER